MSGEVPASAGAAVAGAAPANGNADGGGRSGVPEYFAKDWIKPDFSLNHAALDRLPDHLKGLRGTLERQQNFEGVLMALDHAQSVAGKKALAPLPANAPEQVRSERKQILDMANGVPKEAKDYGFARPADFPEQQWNGKLAEGYAAWAHKHSVSPVAAKELLEMQIGTVREQLTAQAQYETQFWAKEQAAFEGTIQRENIPLDRASALVEKGAVALGLNLEDPATKVFLKGSNARLMAMRHALAIGEDTSVQPDATQRGGGQNYAELANSIMKNPADPLYAAFWNRDGKFSRGDHDSAVAKYHEYLRLDHEAQGKRRQ